MKDITELEKTLHISFREPILLQQALVHRSYLNENPDFELQSNERLEFLGDAMLSVVVAEKLYKDYPDLPEGDMTKLRSALVRGETLARISQRLNLAGYLYLGRGEESGGGRARQSILADALEAIIGAVFIDQGFDACRELILRLYEGEMEKAVDPGLNADFKSRLQELMQSRRREVPEYRVVSAEGPDHDREFVIEVLVGGSVMGRGKGKSKREAEKEAARAALESAVNR
ncbi:MAG: ribonuclease III [Dehalococcoidia bacterium]